MVLSKSLTLLFICFLFFMCAEQNKKKSWDHLYSVNELKEDFIQMRNSLEKMHPALYKFNKKTVFNDIFEKNFRYLNKPLTILEFNKIISHIFAQIGCGHSIVVVPKEFRSIRPDRLFPLELKFINDKAFVAGIYRNNSKIPIGSEILSINQVSIKEIIKNLTSIMSSDGNRISNKISQLNKKFLIYYMFYYYFPEKYSIKYIKPGGKKISLVFLKSINSNELKKYKNENEKNNFSEDTNLNFVIEHKTGTAIIAIKSFGYYEERKKVFIEFLDNSFLKIKEKGIKHLIVDLRGNSGGDPYCSNHLLSYLEKKPIVYFSEEYEGYKELTKPTPLSVNNFLGKTFILVDGGVFSSTGHISALIKYHKIGILVGAETSGTFECNDNTKIVKLKNTGLDLYIATQTYSVAVQRMSNKTGVIPDISIKSTVEDILNKNDSVKSYVLNLIKNNMTIGKH